MQAECPLLALPCRRQLLIASKPPQHQPAKQRAREQQAEAHGHAALEDAGLEQPLPTEERKAIAAQNRKHHVKELLDPRPRFPGVEAKCGNVHFSVSV